MLRYHRVRSWMLQISLNYVNCRVLTSVVFFCFFVGCWSICSFFCRVSERPTMDRIICRFMMRCRRGACSWTVHTSRLYEYTQSYPDVVTLPRAWSIRAELAAIRSISSLQEASRMHDGWGGASQNKHEKTGKQEKKEKTNAKKKQTSGHVNIQFTRKLKKCGLWNWQEIMIHGDLRSFCITSYDRGMKYWYSQGKRGQQVQSVLCSLTCFSPGNDTSLSQLLSVCRRSATVKSCYVCFYRNWGAHTNTLTRVYT